MNVASEYYTCYVQTDIFMKVSRSHTIELKNNNYYDSNQYETMVLILNYYIEFSRALIV